MSTYRSPLVLTALLSVYLLGGCATPVESASEPGATSESLDFAATYDGVGIYLDEVGIYAVAERMAPGDEIMVVLGETSVPLRSRQVSLGELGEGDTLEIAFSREGELHHVGIAHIVSVELASGGMSEEESEEPYGCSHGASTSFCLNSTCCAIDYTHVGGTRRRAMCVYGQWYLYGGSWCSNYCSCRA